MYRDTFDSPYEQYRHRIGQPFRVQKIIDTPDQKHDAEVLPMYEIQFEDGETIEAWPEEVLVPSR